MEHVRYANITLLWKRTPRAPYTQGKKVIHIGVLMRSYGVEILSQLLDIIFDHISNMVVELGTLI